MDITLTKGLGVNPGSTIDDAQYLALIHSKKGLMTEGMELFSYSPSKGKKISGILKGEPEIVNYKGEKVTTSTEYGKYLDKGREGIDQLNFDKMAYIELVEETKKSEGRIKPLNVVFSIQDGIDFLERRESKKPAKKTTKKKA